MQNPSYTLYRLKLNLLLKELREKILKQNQENQENIVDTQKRNQENQKKLADPQVCIILKIYVRILFAIIMTDGVTLQNLLG